MSLWEEHTEWHSWCVHKAYFCTQVLLCAMCDMDTVSGWKHYKHCMLWCQLKFKLYESSNCCWVLGVKQSLWSYTVELHVYNNLMAAVHHTRPALFWDAVGLLLWAFTHSHHLCKWKELVLGLSLVCHERIQCRTFF